MIPYIFVYVFCVVILLPVSAEERKRQLAIDELINTEQTYVDDMVVALEVGNFSVYRVKYLSYARISELTFLPSD